MSRYNLFNQTHKALKALLYHTALTLQQTDFTDYEETEEALSLVSVVIELLEEHSNTEDQYILPAIEPYEPGIVATFNYDHYADLQLSKCVSNTITEFKGSYTNEEKETAGLKITNKFIELMIFTMKHIAKEEDVLNRILWSYYTDEQLRLIESTIAENATEEVQTFVAKWMMRGMNKTEIVKWMKSVEKNATCKVCQTLLEMAETELCEDRFRKVEASLIEGSLVA